MSATPGTVAVTLTTLVTLCALLCPPATAARCASGQSRAAARAFLRHAFLWTPPTARRTSGSGSWRARGRASTSPTGRAQACSLHLPSASRRPSFPADCLCPNSAQGPKKSSPLDSKTLPSRTHSSWGGGGVGSGPHLRGHHPGHPFIQDPAMPPLPPPNTLAQLEEACRRLEEVSKPQKQR